MAALWSATSLSTSPEHIDAAMDLSGLRDRLSTFPPTNCSLRNVVRFFAVLRVFAETSGEDAALAHTSLEKRLRTPLPDHAMLLMCRRTLEEHAGIVSSNRRAFRLLASSTASSTRRVAQKELKLFFTTLIRSVIRQLDGRSSLSADPEPEGGITSAFDFEDILPGIVGEELKAVSISGTTFTEFHRKILDIALIFSVHNFTFVKNIALSVGSFCETFVSPSAKLHGKQDALSSVAKEQPLRNASSHLHLSNRLADSFQPDVPTISPVPLKTTGMSATMVRVVEQYPCKPV